jgi:biuret amidohydrolase
MQQKFGLNIPQTLDEIVIQRAMALLIYDMQVGVISQIRNGPEITSRVLHILQAAREGGFRVFFNRYMTLPKEVAGVSQLRMAMDWQHVDSIDKVQPRFLRDSPEFQLVVELSPLRSEVVFDRISMSAFEGTPLNMVLRDCGINAFVIAGVATEVGIDRPSGTLPTRHRRVRRGKRGSCSAVAGQPLPRWKCSHDGHRHNLCEQKQSRSRSPRSTKRLIALSI